MDHTYINDKSWMYKYKTKHERVSPEFLAGVQYFMDFAVRTITSEGTIKCPCSKCENKFHQEKDVVHFHIIREGFKPRYTLWNFHGESRKRSREEFNEHVNSADDMTEMLSDAFMFHPTNDLEGEERNEEAKKFELLIEDAKRPLYVGCNKYSKLSFIVHLFQLKCLHRWSNKSFSAVLALFKDALPDDNILPSSWYECRKMMSELGLDCKKIHACPNDCILFQKEFENLSKCPRCNASRWKERGENCKGRKNVPMKVVRHFPLIPRLQRLFMSSQTASFMKWHHSAIRDEDGKLCHPRDSVAWKDFDNKHPLFSREPRNVRLGLASDGFSPFKISLGSSRSTWPVVLVVYNLPPWLAMKQSFFIMSLLIDGPKSPGNNIDVYLRPLIDELNTLWEHGVQTYDADKKETFQMRAAVLWTINDFPAYSMLSGWSTKGYRACPICHIHHGSVYLSFSRKCVYMRHRRFLPLNHPWRNDEKTFDGKVENEQAPIPLSGEDVLKCWEGHDNVIFGKTVKNVVYQERQSPEGWKKKSIFFELPYWKTLLVRHNLDVMHIEKNVCDNIVNTILQKDGKSKDNIKARLDMQKMKIRRPLHPKPSKKHAGKFILPHASYSLNNEEKTRFLKVLRELKLPDGFSSNISQHIQVQERKIVGLKSHDCHVLMQQLLPLAMRSTLTKSVGLVLNEYCTFFRELCAKVIDVQTLEKLEKSIPLILCKMERIFPPSFFDVMVHLTIHLATEAKLAGPVQYRWMYPIERYLLTLKNYIRNRSKPEGSIAEGYLMEEVTTFCSRYLHDVETKLNRPVRFEEGPIGAGQTGSLSAEDAFRAHRFLLFNTSSIQPYLLKHKDRMKSLHPDWSEEQIQLEQHKRFVGWFRDHKMPPRNKMKAISSLMQVGSKGHAQGSISKYPNIDVISKRRHCIEHSSRVTTSVARAEEVLESAQADHNREARSSLMQVGSKGHAQGSTSKYPNTDVINKRRHCTEHSSRVTTSIARAEEVLESTQAHHNREVERQVHLSEEVLDAYYEEQNGSEPNISSSTMASQTILRKTRGPTQESAVTPPKGEKWKCLIIDKQPVGKAASKLAIVIGLYARLDGYFPPYKEWKEQSPHSFNDVMKDIMRDYDFVDDEGLPANVNIVTHFCKESLQRKLRDWRCWLKAHYYIEGIPEEVLMKSPDKRVTQENWELILKFWERGNKVSEAERNKKNRGEDRPTHTLGSKSIARHNQDEREKLGGNYTTIGAYLKAHQTKSGGYPDEYTRAMCDKIEEACSQRELMNSSEPSVLSPILDEVYKGHHGGYERGRGLGCSRAIWYNNMQTDTSNETVKNLTLQLQNAKTEIESSKAVIEALRARDGETQARMERMEALLNAHLHSGIAGNSGLDKGLPPSQPPN